MSSKWIAGLARTGVAFVGLSMSAGVWAQSTPPAATGDAGQAADLGSTAADIVVTAQKRSERLLDVPLSVTSVSGADLLAGNKTSLLDYFTSVPGLTIFDDGAGAGLIAIRGITTGGATVPTVGIYVDDVPIGASTVVGSGNNPSLPDFDPSDLERVEVLKGPQGTLYGASTMGGVVRYVTVAPDTNEFSGRIGGDVSKIAHGDWGYGLRGAVNIPIASDTLGLRVSGAHRRDAGYIDNIVDGSKDVNTSKVDSARASLLLKPADNVTLKADAFYHELRGFGSGRVGYSFETDSFIYGFLNQKRVPNVHRDKSRDEIYSLSGNIDLGGADITSVTSFGKFRYAKKQDITSTFGSLIGGALGIPNFGVYDQLNNGTDKFTQELRIASATNPDPQANDIDWLVGAFYTHEKSFSVEVLQPVDARNGDPLAGLPLIVDQIGHNKYDEVAGFADLTYHFSPRLNVQGGIRYSHNRQRSTQESHDSVFGPASFIPGRSSDTVTTYLLALQFKPSRDVTAYARFATGYRPGGPNFILPGSDTATAFQSDSTDNYELGLKASLLDRALYFEASAFHITWSGIQLQAMDARAISFITNAGSAVSNGFEASVQLRAAPGLNLGANVAYTDAHLTADAPSAVFAPKGSRLPYSPRVTASATADYKLPLSSRWDATLGGDVSFAGSRLSDFPSNASDPRIRLGSYAVANLHADVSDGRYSVGLFVKNLFDGHGFVNAASQSLDRRGEYGVVVVQPRTIGVTASAKF